MMQQVIVDVAFDGCRERVICQESHQVEIERAEAISQHPARVDFMTGRKDGISIYVGMSEVRQIILVLPEQHDIGLQQGQSLAHAGCLSVNGGTALSEIEDAHAVTAARVATPAFEQADKAAIPI